MRLALLAALAACSSPEIAKPAPTAVRPAVAAAAASLPDPPTPELRLPGDVRPTQAALELTVLPDPPTAGGRIHFTAEAVRPVRVVWLNATDLAIAHAELDGKTARIVKGGEDFIGLAADRELGAGPHAIDIAFTAQIDRTRSRGIYSEREGNDRYVYTFFEPIDARRAFPCFDEPSYKIPWQLTFHVRRDHAALANAPIERETPEASEMKMVELAVSKPLPSYLVAFVV